LVGLLLTHHPSNVLLHLALYSSLAVRIPVEHAVSLGKNLVNLTKYSRMYEIWEMRNANKIWIQKTEWKAPKGRTKSSRMNNIKIKIKEMECEGLNCLNCNHVAKYKE
jgi:hypothetical protein